MGSKASIYEQHNVERSDRLDFQIRYVAELVPAMAEQWFAEGLRLTDEKFARLLANAVPHDLRLLLDSFADAKGDKKEDNQDPAGIPVLSRMALR